MRSLSRGCRISSPEASNMGFNISWATSLLDANQHTMILFCIYHFMALSLLTAASPTTLNVTEIPMSLQLLQDSYPENITAALELPLPLKNTQTANITCVKSEALRTCPLTFGI